MLKYVVGSLVLNDPDREAWWYDSIEEAERDDPITDERLERLYRVEVLEKRVNGEWVKIDA